MSYNRITWLPDVLRAAGLTVIEHDGWRTRGLSTSQRFEPEKGGVVWHHDASAPGDSPGVPASMIARFESAAAQTWVDREGRWHIIASGRAPHAGVVLPGMPSNYTTVGVETDHTTGEAWPAALLNSLRVGTAAILTHLDLSAADGLWFHKDICSPVGRKVDPAGLTQADERRTVKALMAAPITAKPDSRPTVSLTKAKKAAKRAPWSGIHLGTPARRARRLVKAALKAEKCGTYKAWQIKLGYTGADADGIPGKATLTALGDRHGFRVVA